MNSNPLSYKPNYSRNFSFFSPRDWGEKNKEEIYKVSIVSYSNLISFQTSQAAAKSGLHLVASRITSLPSRARSRPSLRACTQASNATRLATAPGAFPQGCPKVPPPNCNTESSPKISVRAGICQTWIPPDATGNTPGRETQSCVK